MADPEYNDIKTPPRLFRRRVILWLALACVLPGCLSGGQGHQDDAAAAKAGKKQMAPEDTWTRFRGPHGSGLSSATTIPIKVTEADINWKVKLPGTGHSSPVVWGERIFLTSVENAAGRRHVLCLHAADGRELWRKTDTFTKYRQHRYNSFAAATPALDSKHVYVPWTDRNTLHLLALAHDGREIWRRELGDFQAKHGSGASPVVAGGVVILANIHERRAGFLIGLEPDTGRTKWRVERRKGKSTYITPLTYTQPGQPQQVIFTSTPHGMTSLDPATGEVLWELGGLFTNRCVGSPIAANGLVIATAGLGNGNRDFVAVRPGSRAEGIEPREVYKIRKKVPYVPTPIAVGELLFLWTDNGIVTCLRAETGEQLWQERVGGNYFSSPVCVNGKLYGVSTSGKIVVLAASETYQPLAVSELGEPCYATPAIAGGVMYLRTASHLISIGGKAQ